MAWLLQLVIAGLVLGSIYALFAVSLNIVWSVAGVVNIAQGEILAIGAYSMIFLVHSSIPLPLGITALLVGAVVVGAAVNRLFAHLLRQPESEYSTLLVTWGFSLVIIAAIREFVGTDFRSIDILRAPVYIGEARFPQTNFVVLGAAFVAALVLALLLRYSRVGRSLRAVAENSELAASVGVNVSRARTTGFVVGICLAVFAGQLVSTVLVFYPAVGQLFILKGVVIVLVASLGRLFWTWCVGLALGLLETSIQFVSSPLAANLVPFLLLIVVLLLRPKDVRKAWHWVVRSLTPRPTGLGAPRVGP
jgi:branched-subunit amino acid ABC-type transport system permease component